MILNKKKHFYITLITFFLLSIGMFGQTTTDSYKKLWHVIKNDSVAKEKKLHYLNIYYKKALLENNAFETYRALEEQTFLVPYNEGVVLLHKMEPLVQKIYNDSLKGDNFNRNTIFYYKHRQFDKALEYAVQSELFNKENNKLYNLNSVRITIGNIYYHTRNYERAVTYFKQAKDYFKNKKDANHKQSYVISLYSLGKTYWKSANTELLSATIKESEQAIALLTPKHFNFETAYLNYLKGGLYYLLNEYVTAHTYFTQALATIKENEDFSNEYAIYLYLGKIAWQQNKKQEAVTYFTKIEHLFKEKKFLNYELREAFDYLIKYYKETHNTKLQLQVTESLIALNQQFEKEQQHLTHTLHYDLETKKLEASKTDLLDELNNSNNLLIIGLSVGGVFCLLLMGYGIWQYKQKKQWRLQYNTLIKQTDQPIRVINTDDTTQFSNVSDATPPSETDQIEKENKLSVTELRLLKDLETFELKKEFLNPIKLDELATKLGTNRNTLSKLINAQKNVNFNQYINNLRIKQIVIDLKNDKNLRKLSMSALAEAYGFSNAKTFTTQFKMETQLTPAYFIEQLQLDDMQ